MEQINRALERGSVHLLAARHVYAILESRAIGQPQLNSSNTWLTEDGIAEFEVLGLSSNDLPFSTLGFANMIPGQFISI